ncbi:hypothetical protein C8Q76DRAFT_798158 [Earliella scabrosa]|nr:hypothetical protein C8Q76DRAFT_798158 [Earliella scabrosa]
MKRPVRRTRQNASIARSTRQDASPARERSGSLTPRAPPDPSTAPEPQTPTRKSTRKVVATPNARPFVKAAAAERATRAAALSKDPAGNVGGELVVAPNDASAILATAPTLAPQPAVAVGDGDQRPTTPKGRATRSKKSKQGQPAAPIDLKLPPAPRMTTRTRRKQDGENKTEEGPAPAASGSGAAGKLVERTHEAPVVSEPVSAIYIGSGGPKPTAPVQGPSSRQRPSVEVSPRENTLDIPADTGTGADPSDADGGDIGDDVRPHPMPDPRPRPPPDARPLPPADARPLPPADAHPLPPPDARPHPPADARSHPPPDARSHPPPDARPHLTPDAQALPTPNVPSDVDNRHLTNASLAGGSASSPPEGPNNPLEEADDPRPDVTYQNLRAKATDERRHGRFDAIQDALASVPSGSRTEAGALAHADSRTATSADPQTVAHAGSHAVAPTTLHPDASFSARSNARSDTQATAPLDADTTTASNTERLDGVTGGPQQSQPDRQHSEDVEMTDARHGWGQTQMHEGRPPHIDVPLIHIQTDGPPSSGLVLFSIPLTV